MKTLLSVPPALASLPPPLSADFMTCDPPGGKLGSGGGTAHLLREGHRSLCDSLSLANWTRSEKKILLHAGGQSRRLPAYAPSGKALLPVPVFRWSTGQRLDQTLLDLQKPLLESLLQKAPPSLSTLVASGDVLVWNDTPLPAVPEVDVLCVGLWDSPEVASHHGVFFTPRQDPGRFSYMLQKPSPSEIQARSAEHMFLLDVGIWLFSDRAMEVMLRKCGGEGAETFSSYDLYGEFGEALGDSPTRSDPEISSLTCAVLPLDHGEFYHFGSAPDLIRSSLALQNRVHDQRRIRSPLIKPHPAIFVQNAVTHCPLRPENHDVWIENAHLGAGWTLTNRHVITGVPANDWQVTLPPEICLDVVPLTGDRVALRVYGFNDPFRGSPEDPATLWMGKPVADWFTRRGLTLPEGGDLQQCEIFPVLGTAILSGELLAWMIDATDDTASAEIYRNARKLSAESLSVEADLPRLFAQRAERLSASLPALARHAERSVFHQIDLEHAAAIHARGDVPLPENPPDPAHHLFGYIHDRMFHAAVKRGRGINGDTEDAAAFTALREAILTPYHTQTLYHRNTALSDQVIWARSPVRLDLAGGWTDTPPHCFLHGGRVINLAVELNGQPPIQVFARVSKEPRVTLRSIDLGITEHLATYDDISGYAALGSGFSIPRAALALAGFHPDFQAGARHTSLRDQLEGFGGGIELSLLCAVPKGSGLGTSSILAATVLGVLSELCGLGWDRMEIGNRTLALEQMLTSGGGWQDQFGGITRGLKLLSTPPGLDQTPEIRWLPDHMFTDTARKSGFLLYYTGVTRVARQLLGEIVRGMFLNKREHHLTLEALRHHARDTYESLQRDDPVAVGRNIGRTWELNQTLDPGTNPPEIRSLLSMAEDLTHGHKLLGAGGGGYLLMAAKDPEAAALLRKRFLDNPPNDRARFVDFSLSTTGLQITRS